MTTKPFILKIIHKVAIADRDAYLDEARKIIEALKNLDPQAEGVEYVNTLKVAFGRNTSLEYEHQVKFENLTAYDNTGYTEFTEGICETLDELQEKFAIDVRHEWLRIIPLDEEED